MLVAMRYRDFHDVPRIFVVRHRSHCYLFDSVFDKNADEYSQNYAVYELPDDTLDQIDSIADWSDLPARGRKIATVAVGNVQFDETKRRFINSDIFARLLKR